SRRHVPDPHQPIVPDRGELAAIGAHGDGMRPARMAGAHTSCLPGRGVPNVNRSLAAENGHKSAVATENRGSEVTPGDPYDLRTLLAKPLEVSPSPVRLNVRAFVEELPGLHKATCPAGILGQGNVLEVLGFLQPGEGRLGCRALIGLRPPGPFGI